MVSNEPVGWSYLQGMALRERDPKRLIEIIDQMNRLLDEQERWADEGLAARNHPSPRAASAISE
jgi:hypothetical protein